MASTKPVIPLRRLSRTGTATALAVAVLTAIALTVAFRGVSESRRPAAKVAATTGNLAPENSKKGRAILNASNIGPGDASTGTVSIRNSASVSTSMTLSKAKLKQRFGAGGGRLADRLLLDVADVTNRRRVVAVYRGPIASMPIRRLGVWRPRESRTYRFVVTFVSGGAEDNAYMGASLSLSYRWTARAAKVSHPLARPSGEDPLARRRIAVIARCPQACTISASGAVRARSGRRTTHLGSPRPSRRRLRANRPTPVYLPLDHRTLASIRRALRRGQRVEAVVDVVARRGGAKRRSVVRVPVLRRSR